VCFILLSIGPFLTTEHVMFINREGQIIRVLFYESSITRNRHNKLN